MGKQKKKENDKLSPYSTFIPIILQTKLLKNIKNCVILSMSHKLIKKMMKKENNIFFFLRYFQRITLEKCKFQMGVSHHFY